MKKALSILLAIGLLAVWTPVSLAATDQPTIISPFYLHIKVMSAGLAIDSSGRANCGATADCMDKTVDVKLTMSLQQYKNNAWSTIKSWSITENGQYGLFMAEDYYVTSGYKYRVETNVKVYNLSGKLLEDQTMYSKEVSY